MLTLATNHEGKLTANQADPVVAAILAVFTAILQSYRATDINLRSALGFYKGETQSVESMFKQLTEVVLPAWEGQIFYYYPKGTSTATQLFPQNHTPFNSGTYESRIQAIATLALGCNALPNLGPISVIITAFHVQISSARALQLSDGEGKVELLRDLRETARVTVCQHMYGNLGLLMNHHRTDPLEVNRYFDFSLLRKLSKSIDDTVLTFFVTDSITGVVIAGATTVITLATGEVFTKQTDANGKVVFTLKGLTEPVEASLAISATGYMTLNEDGSIVPGEDRDGDFKLIPNPPTPPTP